MALLDTLAAYNGDVFLDTDPKWRQFIKDHKLYLKSISQRRTPSADLMTQVRFDLTWYLAYIGITRPIAWIVAYINDLDSSAYFDHSQSLYVPSISQIQTLYQSYITTRNIQS